MRATIVFVISFITLILLAGCASAPTPHGEVKEAEGSSGELAQSDSNRVATLAMRDNLNSLYRLMDKLYRRNPAEWQKTAANRDAAIQQVRSAIEQQKPWKDLHGLRDIAAM